MRAGSCSASSTAFSLMARCPATRPSVAATTHSTPSSVRRAPASMCRAASSWTWSRPSWTRCARAPIASSSTRSSSYQAS
eukprot:15404813-Alexandrium_andersonii.AAC.1